MPSMKIEVLFGLMCLGDCYACAALIRGGHVSPTDLNTVFDLPGGVGSGSILTAASLIMSQTGGVEALVKALLDAKADASGGGGNPAHFKGAATPLMVACQRGRLEIVKLLLANGAAASMDAEDVENGIPPALMQYLSNRMYRRTSEGEMEELPDAMMVSLDQTFACAEALLEHRADVNRQDGAGYTPLMAAAQWNNVDAIRLLLKHKADVNASNPREGPGFTALMAAIAEGNADCVKALLDAGADDTLTWGGGPSGVPIDRPLDALGIATFRKENAMHSAQVQAGGSVTKKVQQAEECIAALTEFNRFIADACEHGVLSEAAADALTDRLARGESQRTILEEYAPAMKKAEGKKLMSDGKLRMVARRRLAAFEHDRTAAIEDEHLYPKPGAVDARVGGGSACVVGLEKRPELNGQTGRITSFNSDGRRRFGLKLRNGKTLSLNPINLAPVEDQPELDFPTRCEGDSRVNCAKLQKEAAAMGLDVSKLVDWTHLDDDCRRAEGQSLLRSAHWAQRGLLPLPPRIYEWREQLLGVSHLRPLACFQQFRRRTRYSKLQRAVLHD